jgi:hypothetical protein
MAGGQSGFRLGVASASAGAQVIVEVFTDATTASRAGRLLPALGASTDVVIGFGELVQSPDAAAPADLSNVGAIRLTLLGTDRSLSLEAFETLDAAVEATKTDELVDLDEDGQVDPGDTLEYTIEITSTGGEVAGAGLTDTLDSDLTLVEGSLDATPLARNDAYASAGGLELSVGAPGLLGNDSDPDGGAVSVAPASQPASARGGTVTYPGSDGSFVYTPPPGAVGVDAFSYTIEDATGNTDTATVMVFLDGLVWFVDDTACAAPCGSGTLGDPFGDFSELNGAGGAGDLDGPGDVFYVRTGSGATDTGGLGGLELEDGQQLLGEGVDLVLNGQTLVVGSPAGRPTLVNGAGPGVVLARDNTVRGLDLGDASGFALSGPGVGALTVAEVAVANATGGGVSLLGGTLSVTLDDLTSTDSASQGIDLGSVDGSFAVSGTTAVDASAGTALRVQDSPGAAFDFGATLIGGTPAAGAGVDVATGNAGAAFVFANLDVTTSAGAGLVAGASTLTIGGAANAIAATGGAAVDLTGTTLSGGATFAGLSSAVSAGRGVGLSGVTGSFAVSGATTVSGNAGTGIDVSGGSSAVSFAAVTLTSRGGAGIAVNGRTGTNAVSFGTTALGTSPSTSDGVAIGTVGANSAMTTVSFAGLEVTNTGAGARGLVAAGGGVLEVAPATGGIGTSAATALALDGMSLGGAGVSFTSISATGLGGNAGIAVDGVGGPGGFIVSGDATIGGMTGSAAGIAIRSTSASFSFAGTGGGITSTNAGTAFDVGSAAAGSGGSGDVLFAGPIANTAGRAVSVQQRTGGSVTFSGDVDETGSGLLVQNNGGGGSTTFSGGTKKIETGTNASVTLAGNTGHTISFTNGGLDVDTTSGAGFTATGGGTVIVTTGASPNSVTTTTGTGVDIANTTIGASGVTFESVSVNGAANGIVLDTTGTTGSFSVTGDGTTGAGTSANNDSGGTIQNTTGDGIQLTSASNVSLDQMRVQDAAGHGIHAQSVTDLTILRANLVSNGDANQEHGLRSLNGAGTLTVDNTLGVGNFDAHLRVFQQTGNDLTLFTVDDGVFQNVTTGSFEDGISFELQAGADGDISVTNSTFSNHDGDHVQASSNGSSVMDVVLTGNTMTGAAGNLGAGITVNSADSFSGTTTLDISNNDIQKANDNSTSINVNLGSSTSAGTYTGTISNNTIGTLGTADSAGDTGIAVEVNRDATMTVAITGNVVREFDNFGIDGGAVDAVSGPGTLNLTVTGNTATSSDSNAFAAMFVDAQTTNVVCADIGGDTAALENTFSASAGFTDVAFQTGGSGVINLEDYGGAADNQAQIEAYIQGRNSGTPGVQLNPGGTAIQGGGACPTP